MKKTFSRIMIILLLIGALAFSFNIQQAESSEPPETEWTRTYGGTKEDVPKSVIQTDDGGYALAGRTNSSGAGDHDFWLVKTDGDGNMQWNRTYGSTGTECAEGGTVQTSDGGYLLVGHKGVEPNRDMWVVKTDFNGTMEWNKTYGGPNDDTGRGAISADDDGGYTLIGNTRSFGEGDYDFWLIKINSTGDVQWNYTYGGANTELAACLIQTNDSGYALAGRTRSFDAGSQDFWLVKTNSTGGIEWNQTYGTSDFETATAVIQTNDGGFALAGQKGIHSTDDCWLVRTNATGHEQWNETYGPDEDHALSMIQTGDGGYVLVGATRSFEAGGRDFWVIKTDFNGTREWNQTYGGASDDVALSVVQTDDGGYAVAGFTESFDDGDRDFWLIKIEAERMPQIKSPCIWLYDFDRYDLDTLVSDLNNTGFKTVLLSTDITALRAHEESYIGKLRSFIGKAEEKGISVHAMILQAPEFVNRTEHKKALQDLGEVLDYNSENPDRAFEGIHIDVEPYGLDAWKEASWEDRNGIMAMYIELLSKMHKELRGKRLMFSAAHPHWYRSPEIPDELPNFQTSQFGQYLDAIVLMVYDSENMTSSWDTSGEILELAKEELEEADTAGNVHIVVGVGVHEFWKFSWLNDSITQIDEELETNPSYKGVSVFKYKTFREIRTWEYRIEDRHRHTVLMVNTTDKHFRFDNASTPEEEFSKKEATYMRTRRGITIIIHKDEEIKLSARIVDRWMIGRCSATAEDMETGKRYALNDRYWILRR